MQGVADRISSPPQASTLDLCAHLPDDIRRQFLSVDGMLKPDRSAVPTRGSPCWNETEWLPLLRKMHALNMADFLSTSDAPAAANGDMLVAGVFAAAAPSVDEDRLISDRRGSNQMECVLGSPHLPHCSRLGVHISILANYRMIMPATSK